MRFLLSHTDYGKSGVAQSDRAKRIGFVLKTKSKTEMLQSQPAHDPNSAVPVQTRRPSRFMAEKILKRKAQRTAPAKLIYEAAVGSCHYCGRPTDCTDGIVPVCPVCDVLSSEDMERLLQQGSKLLNCV